MSLWSGWWRRPRTALPESVAATVRSWEAMPAPDERARPADTRFVVVDTETTGLDPGRAELLARVAEYGVRHAVGEIPRPPHWSGFRVAPERIELWQDKPFRLHERRLFIADGAGGWRESMLYP